MKTSLRNPYASRKFAKIPDDMVAISRVLAVKAGLFELARGGNTVDGHLLIPAVCDFSCLLSSRKKQNLISIQLVHTISDAKSIIAKSILLADRLRAFRSELFTAAKAGLSDATT
ncbi:hypothetical protein [Ruegeria arenilitoris]|nr:hypothetical protein [Ruegeria arenilitoris]